MDKEKLMQAYEEMAQMSVKQGFPTFCDFCAKPITTSYTHPGLAREGAAMMEACKECFEREMGLDILPKDNVHRAFLRAYNDKLGEREDITLRGARTLPAVPRCPDCDLPHADCKKEVCFCDAHEEAGKCPKAKPRKAKDVGDFIEL